jgi:predicted nucleic acid-binding protein
MSTSSGFIAVLDANVLYPAPVRDILLHIAAKGLYQPKWSSEIQDEWLRNLVVNRPDLKKENLDKTVAAMNVAFPDADVTNYEDLIPALNLPDEDDRHVMAAAIRGKANVIVTENSKDFPQDYVNTHDIEVFSADEFLSRLIDIDKATVLEALAAQIRTLKNPPQTKEQVLATLERNGLKKMVAALA